MNPNGCAESKFSAPLLNAEESKKAASHILSDQIQPLFVLYATALKNFPGHARHKSGAIGRRLAKETFCAMPDELLTVNCYGVPAPLPGHWNTFFEALANAFSCFDLPYNPRDIGNILAHVPLFPETIENSKRLYDLIEEAPFNRQYGLTANDHVVAHASEQLFDDLILRGKLTGRQALALHTFAEQGGPNGAPDASWDGACAEMLRLAFDDTPEGRQAGAWLASLVCRRWGNAHAKEAFASWAAQSEARAIAQKTACAAPAKNSPGL